MKKINKWLVLLIGLALLVGTIAGLLLVRSWSVRPENEFYVLKIAPTVDLSKVDFGEGYKPFLVLTDKGLVFLTHATADGLLIAEPPDTAALIVTCYPNAVRAAGESRVIGHWDGKTSLIFVPKTRELIVIESPPGNR